MAVPPNVELEAAKFLQKLILESKDEPTKLATKLYVILQHMRSSGKENSMPYHVISRAMETVINQHGLDIDALMSSRLPLTTGTQVGDSASSQFGGPSRHSDTSLASSELTKVDAYASNRPPVAPSSVGHDFYQGSVSHLNSKSLDHESPSSFDTRSAKSLSEERRDSANREKANKNDNKKGNSKRKRADALSTSERQFGNFQPLDHGQFINMNQSSSQMEHSGSLTSAMRQGLRPKQETQHQSDKSLDSTNISNSLSRAPHSRTPEEIEVSSAHNALGLQQGGSMPSSHDVLNSKGLWNQNKLGLPFENSQVPRFSFQAGGGNSSAEALMHLSAASPIGSAGKVYGTAPGPPNLYAATETRNPNSEQFSSTYDKALEHEGGILHTSANANNAAQGGMQNNVTDMTMLRSTGKLPISQAPPTASGMPFKEQHLKQLRAQCLVFLAFRNGLMPKKLHLDIALGNFFPKEDGPCKEMIDQKGKEQSVGGTSNTPDVTLPFGRPDNNPRDSERSHVGPSSIGVFAAANLSKEGDSMRRKPESEMQTRMIAQAQSHLPAMKGTQPDPKYLENMHTDQASTFMGLDQKMKIDVTGWAGNVTHDEASKVSLPPSSATLIETGPERKDNAPSQSFGLGCSDFQGSRHADALPNFQSSEQWKQLSRMDGGNHVVAHDDTKISNKRGSLNGNPSTVVETDHEDEDISLSTDLPSSPKYTTSEKWITGQQKRKLRTEQTWALKQQKTKQRIYACSEKLKDKVSSSEDISAKTRSVIELKKLQLLELQSRLRNDILNDFFKPIASDMDRLKSIKKHRIGRKSKQLEKYEQKMKEERQKRFRERQKDFFNEIEVHKERLEDVSKMRRERWKGFNKYAREFHKRKERVHREKIDRIQREKINLLKINDVEGYLRMVQDAKSDRVKQLLKETEKYLQKLGSKLQDAKVINRCFEIGMDDRNAGVMEKNEFTIENEDETDQAKHYLESNEKYYLMAHSIKENVAEQPSCLVGGKLREYQMNGLRWLVSLYNNHLNGILADEMGLGKTVQVISLICHLMETKNDRGPFLVVVPSSVLPGWNSEINFWAPSINKIVYSGPPEERRRLFKERILPQKFNVLLTTYEYLMNKHDRPKLSKLHWHYVIIDEGHRIKNASCKLNAELKYYRSSHRLLLTGTPLQNNLEELWALLNFLLPNIFNSAEDFSQWFNKPFETNGDSSPDEALLSEEENLLIINRLHQVLRPFVLRRLKHKVENELPEKIERLVRCDASAYQKLLMKRVEDNLGALGTSKARSVHNSVMELRNICNHPYLSQLHAEEVHDFIPNHYLPNIVRLCGKLEMLDRILPKLKATGHRVLLFSTMTRLLDVMEDYLCWKQYKYLRLDGHTCGGDRGALIDEFNRPDSPFFIFLLSIRAGGVGVNLQAADTVIIFDTDWNPQVDLQAQARAHRIGQKREVLVLRFETVQTVEEQVRAAAEHKLGVANQSITAGFFDNNTSAEDRREYLESLLRECKKEEAAPVLHDDALNDLIARSESEIDIFESIDKRRQEEEMAAWKLVLGQGTSSGSEPALAVPSRLVTDDDLKLFSEAMKVYDAPTPVVVSNVGVKRKGQYLGGLDTQHYGRGKRAREVRSYEEQWTEDEFEKMCQVDESPESPKLKGEVKELNLPVVASDSVQITVKTETVIPPFEQPVQPPISQLAQIPIPQPSRQSPVPQPAQSLQQAIEQSKDVVTTPSKRGRGRPKRSTTQISASQMVVPEPSRTVSSTYPVAPAPDSLRSTAVTSITGIIPPFEVSICPSSRSTAAIMPSAAPVTQPATTIIPSPSVPTPDKRGGRKPAAQSGETPTPKRRGRKPNKVVSPSTPVLPAPSGTDSSATGSRGEIGSSIPLASGPDGVSGLIPSKDGTKEASSYSVVPVHFPSSGTTISSSPIFSSSSKLTGTTGSTHDLHAGATDLQPTTLPLLPSPNSQPVSAGTEPSSQPNNPSFPSVPLGSQSVQPSDSVPKQVKGRGRKGPSEVTPRRRGRKPQAAATTVVPDRAGGQEATSLEPPEKKSRVSAGRKAVATRSKQQNEAQKLNNVVQAGLNLTSTDESSHSAHNKQGTSSSVTMESATVKVNQLDVPVSGDAIIMSTKVEVCHSSADNPSGIAIQNAGIKDVTFGETVTKKPEVNDFESKNNTAVLVSSTTFSERETDVRSVADGNLGGPTLSDTSTDLTENQSLELKKSLDLSTSETMIVTVSSDSKTNSASLTLGTDLVSDHVKLGCPSEKEGGENMEEVIKPQSDGSVSPTPEVHKPDESQSNATNVVQNSADPGKLTEESLRIHDDNGSTAHMGEKPLDAKVSVVYVTEKPVNYIEEKLVAVDNAMVDIRVSADSSKGERAMDGKGAVVGSSGAKYSSDKTAEVKAEAEREFEAKESSESKDESEDPETRGGKQDLAAVGGTMEVAESSKPSKELGEVIHIGDRELHDIEETAVEIHQPTVSRLVGHCDSQVEFDGAGGIEDDNKQGEFNSEGERVGPKNLELKHDFAEVESIMTEGETKPSEEVEEEAFKEAAEHDRKEQQCVQLYATGEAVIEVGQSQTQAKGESEHIGKSDESSEQRDLKMEVQEGAPEFIGETHQLLEIGNIEGSKAEPSEEVDKVAQGAIENQKSGQGDGMLNAIRKPIPEIVDTKELLELGQTQAKQEPIGYTGDLEECSKQEEVHEDERSVPERTEERHDTAAGGTNGGGEVIPSEKVNDVHVGSGVLEATMNVTSEIKQAVADVFVQQIETPADENKPFEKIEDDFKETIQFEGTAQQRDEVSHVTGEAKFEQVTEGINVTQSRTEEEAKPDEKSDFSEAIEPESSRLDEGGIFHVIEETVTEIGPTKEEAAVGLGQTEEREVKADEKVEVVFQEAIEHERKELTEEPVFESSQTQEELVKSCERVEEETSAEIVQRLEELPVEQCQTHVKDDCVKDDCETSEKAEVFQKATEHERKESTEEPIIESIQTQDVLVKSCEIVEEETSAEILQRSEDLPVEQCQTHVKDDCETFEKAEVFQQATEHERKELMEEPIIESIRTQEELVKSCEIVEEETSAEILQRSEELPVEQCQTHVKDDCVKDDCETSEKAEVFEQATEHERKESTEEPIIESIQTQEELVKSSEIVGEETSTEILQRSEELPVEQCQTHVKDDCETSEKAEVFQQATEHERKELTEEPIIESSQTQEELVKSCEIVEETSAEILQRSEELPVEQCQTHVEGDCETSEEVEVFQETKSTEEPIIGSSQTQEELVKSCEVIEETSAEIVQRSEELPVEQCQTHAKDDCGTFEKFEVQKETKHESKESTEEPIIESSQTQEELAKSCELVKEQTSAEIVQRLEELPVEQCQNRAKDDCETSEKVEVFQETTEIMERLAEITKTSDELLDEQPQTQAEEVKHFAKAVAEIGLTKDESLGVVFETELKETVSHEEARNEELEKRGVEVDSTGESLAELGKLTEAVIIVPGEAQENEGASAGSSEDTLKTNNP